MNEETIYFLVTIGTATIGAIGYDILSDYYKITSKKNEKRNYEQFTQLKTPSEEYTKDFHNKLEKALKLFK